jgi:hypothetical protein
MRVIIVSSLFKSFMEQIMPAKVRTTEEANQAQARKADMADQKKNAIMRRIDDQTNDAKALASKIERLRALRIARDEELARNAPPPAVKKVKKAASTAAKSAEKPVKAAKTPKAPRPVLTKADIE